MPEPMKKADFYASTKTYVEGLVDITLFTSNVTQVATIAKSPGGVNTGEEITRVVFLSICMAIQVVLMFLLGYQRSRNIDDLAPNIDDTEEKKRARTKEERKLNAINYVAIMLSTAIVLANICIAVLDSSDLQSVNQTSTVQPTPMNVTN